MTAGFAHYLTRKHEVGFAGGGDSAAEVARYNR